MPYQSLQRNLATVETLLNELSNPAIPLSSKKLKQYLNFKGFIKLLLILLNKTFIQYSKM